MPSSVAATSSVDALTPGQTVPGGAGHVVRIIARLNVGGPARQVILLDERLRHLGWTSLLVHGEVGPREDTLEPAALARGVTTLKLPELGRRVRPWSDLVAFVRIVRLLFRARPDVVHTHTAKAGAVGRLAAAVYNSTRSPHQRCLVVHTFHGHVFEGYFGPRETWLIRHAERALAGLSDRIIAISERQRTDLTERVRVAPRSRVAVVPLGLELDGFLHPAPRAAARQRLGLSPDAVVVGFIGRLVPIKRPELLLSAFETVARRCSHVELLVVGDGELRPALEAQVRASGLSNRIVFAGWRHDLDTVYGALDIVALTSRNEGTPVALIEAMASGLPVVATDVGGVSDLVEHETTGLVVPATDDGGAIAVALIRLTGDRAERTRFGEAGRARVFSRHGADRLASDLDRLYRAGVDEKRTRRT
jgi:glycosyltransferase involved in cell wall biosynthesis